MKKLVLLLTILLVSSGIYVLRYERDVISRCQTCALPSLRDIVSGSGPAIEIQRQADSRPGTFVVTASDPHFGIRSLQIDVEQQGKTISLAAQDFEPVAESASATVSAFEKIKEGPVNLIVQTTNGRIFGKKTTKTLALVADISPPRIELLTHQHIVSHGGAELVFFRLTETNPTGSWISVGDVRFPAFPAEYVDERLKKFSGIQAAFFALPYGYARETTKVAIEAEDIGGNRTTHPLSFRVEKKRQPEAKLKLGEQFFKTKTAELLPGYYRASGKAPESGLSLIDSFRLVNENYRAIIEKRLRDMLRREVKPRLWHEIFLKPMPSKVSSNFAEQRTYWLGGQEFGKSLHNGFDLASVEQDAVTASNDGVVLFAGDLGIYGTTIVLEHGMGLSTLYGHLSSVAVNTGDMIKRGQEIGRTGETGLAGGDHLHFEVRLFDVPVTPIEWWDPNWIEDNIDIKVTEVLDRMGDTEPVPNNSSETKVE